MASSIVREIIPPRPPLQNTVDRIEFALVILTDLIVKFPQHSKSDVWDVIVYLLRQISDIQFSLLMI